MARRRRLTSQPFPPTPRPSYSRTPPSPRSRRTVRRLEAELAGRRWDVDRRWASSHSGYTPPMPRTDRSPSSSLSSHRSSTLPRIGRSPSSSSLTARGPSTSRTERSLSSTLTTRAPSTSGARRIPSPPRMRRDCSSRSSTRSQASVRSERSLSSARHLPSPSRVRYGSPSHPFTRSRRTGQGKGRSHLLTSAEYGFILTTMRSPL